MLDQQPLSPAPTRRRTITAGAIALLGSRSRAQADSAVIDSKAIHQEENFNASTRPIYEILLDSKQFTAFGGGRAAEIHPEVGGTFALFAGHIIGRNLELVPNQRIVQAWRVVDWPPGIFSIARFEFKAQGSGTRIILDHTGFPSERAEHLASGWRENYWAPLRNYLG